MHRPNFRATFAGIPTFATARRGPESQPVDLVDAAGRLPRVERRCRRAGRRRPPSCSGDRRRLRAGAAPPSGGGAGKPLRPRRRRHERRHLLATAAAPDPSAARLELGYESDSNGSIPRKPESRLRGGVEICPPDLRIRPRTPRSRCAGPTPATRCRDGHRAVAAGSSSCPFVSPDTATWQTATYRSRSTSTSAAGMLGSDRSHCRRRFLTEPAAQLIRDSADSPEVEPFIAVRVLSFSLSPP